MVIRLWGDDACPYLLFRYLVLCTDRGGLVVVVSVIGKCVQVIVTDV